MTEESEPTKKLYLLNAGGWADDIDEEEDTHETKSWEKIEKPNVVPIGSSDFEIKGGNDQKVQKNRQKSQNNGQRNYRNENRNDHRNGKQNYFDKPRGGNRNDYKGERRQNGRSNGYQQDEKWKANDNERKNESNPAPVEDNRVRQRLNLKPRSVTESSDVPTVSNQTDSPFGSATPKVTGRENLETTSEIKEQPQESLPQEQEEPTREDSESSRPRQNRSFEKKSNGPRNFGSKSSHNFEKRKYDQNKKFHGNNNKTNSDGFQTQNKNRGNRGNHQDYNRVNTKKAVQESKPVVDTTNTRNSFSLLSMEE